METAAAVAEPTTPKAVTPSDVPTAQPTTLAQDTTTQKANTPEAATDSTRKKEHAQPAYRLLISAIGAPSLSAVRDFHTARIGGDLGLSLEYRLTNRLRVRASLIRSVKRYGAASSDYTPQPNWGWYPGNYEVNGNCRVTELPIDLRYDFINRPTYTFFVSAGMNSLLMRNERYNYDYQLNGQTNTAAACVENGSNYAFGMVNLAAGAERQLSNRWSLQAEPFLKLPLGNIGAGKVRLSSAGLLFSLKYGFLPTHRAVAP
ncbi:hypothetical protein GCM10011383_04070 [Hymenobacter cavernae]|uniref:Outer membrane protein beta-barrel domain-containing protein n=2 Tax=Hymenobacter cavernae TaxID=2044852 RepID=A0ABQ1TKD9_9BACT|nr:hypothetical protein GCM10011383_04070 [Hymenobacter cavernae]